jgi:propanol-preferring alcohol dehydrogenase
VPFHTAGKLEGPGIEKLAVFGVGPIGLGNVLLQSHVGRKVLAVDINDFRLELAGKLGAAAALNSGEGDILKRIRSHAESDGVDAAIEAAGCPETVRLCFDAVRPAGTVVFNGEQGPVELSPSEHFIRRDVAAVGSWYYHFGEFDGMLDLFREGLRVKDLITHRFRLEDADEAYREFASGRSGKVLLLSAL